MCVEGGGEEGAVGLYQFLVMFYRDAVCFRVKCTKHCIQTGSCFMIAYDTAYKER